jgi:hypothetical protein
MEGDRITERVTDDRPRLVATKEKVDIIVYVLPSNTTTLIKCPVLWLTVINKQLYFTYAQRDGQYQRKERKRR